MFMHAYGLIGECIIGEQECVFKTTPAMFCLRTITISSKCMRSGRLCRHVMFS